MNMKRSLILGLLILTGCNPQTSEDVVASIDELVEEYLFLELSMALHDPAHVDAYFGPEGIKAEAEAANPGLEEIRARSKTLASQLPNTDGDVVRIEGLLARLRALDARIDLASGKSGTFDEESERLFGVRAPDYDAAHFDAILAEIDALLPGDDELSVRVNAFRSQFEIPPDKLAEVLETATEECRRRTLEFIELPEGESYTVEYVTDKPWSGYNWYQGDSQSLIQFNTDLPRRIDGAVDLGCHEGYPGHHTYNALLELNLVHGKGWAEYSLYPLFSPQSLIAEGSGNYGIQLAFPDDERVRFEREVLFPIAGLDASEADRFYALDKLLGKLNYAGNEAARDYLNGDMSREQAIEWLVHYSLMTPERADQRADFIDTYRSYVINYNYGKDLVREYMERGTDDPAERWSRFEELLSSPKLPSDL